MVKLLHNERWENVGVENVDKSTTTTKTGLKEDNNTQNKTQSAHTFDASKVKKVIRIERHVWKT